MIDKLADGAPSHRCYESIEIRGEVEIDGKTVKEQYEIRVGNCVYYQYDDDDGKDLQMTVACVLLLYSGEGGEPRWKHDVFFSAR